ncbi:MAG: hypothetical protein R2865_17295 [Deinococcales bacterium]
MMPSRTFAKAFGVFRNPLGKGVAEELGGELPTPGKMPIRMPKNEEEKRVMG